MKWIVSAVVALCIGGIAGTALGQGSSGRIAIVDFSKIFNEYHKTKAATDKLKETFESYQKELEGMRADYSKITEELAKLREDAERPDYSAEVKEQKRKALQEKLVETQKRDKAIADFGRTHQQLHEEQRQRMRTAILQEIKDVIAKESRSLNFLIVFDKSGITGNGVSSIMFHQESLDITEDILRILNRNAPKTGDKKPETKKETPAAEKKATDEKAEEKQAEPLKPEEKK